MIVKLLSRISRQRAFPLSYAHLIQNPPGRETHMEFMKSSCLRWQN